MSTWLLLVFATVMAEASLTYEEHVRPILKEFCFDCHGAEKELEADLDLRLKRLILRGGESGPAIVPGEDPQDSLLVRQLRDGEMPPSGKKVPPDKIAVIEQWIESGAATANAEPESLRPGEIFITAGERAFWAFQPITRPKLNETHHPRARTAIDELIAGDPEFTFAPDADRRTLIRRLSLGLTGLPPNTQQIETFLSDSSEQAYERLIDRLLDSPHYGERWGRHWLDVAGYADSEGATNADTPRAWAWQYRDYVIRAFNADKPFDQFIREQLAGDERVPRPHKNLSPNQIELLTATGFLRMAADGTGSGANDEASRNQTLADTLQIVSSAFLGLTLECAQCHDHRYDPIPQQDYFQLRAVFEPALNPKHWKTPAQRLVSLYTDDDHAAAAKVEAEASSILKEKSTLQDRYIEEALRKEVSRFPENLRESLFTARMTPANKRTPIQKELLQKHPSANITGGNLYQYNQKAANELKEFDKRAANVRERKPYHAYLRAITEDPEANVETRLFHRGDHRQPVGDVLQPAALRITAQPGNRFTIPHGPGRRTAFAQWLTSGKHPLVARVLANRVWMHHFGRGLVGTPGDFGVLGERPTHPELLDYLADELMTNGWSLKKLHRLILRSTVYRQASVSDRVHAYDHFSMQRLDAETLRDRVLAVSGLLDTTFFGPPIAVSENDAGQFSIKAPRRSLYATARRTQPITFLQSFDAPVMETNCNRRETSNAATQALMIMNGSFHLESAKQFAQRVSRLAGESSAEQVAHAFMLAYGRPARSVEIKRSIAFLSEGATLEQLCHALLSSNEMLYVD